MIEVGGRVQRFEVVAHLGTGGMGSVYRARDPQLERDVAIKVLARPDARRPTGLTETDTVDLRSDAPASTDDLLREARMMARLSHPNVLPVYEVGLAEGSVFVVMEYIDGSDLRAWLSTPRDTAAIVAIFAQAARGLTAAHACGIVHRDFKPENVLVGRDGRVRVADFGLSKLVVRPHYAMRRMDAAALGTPRYMAPELWRGEPASARSDVFAFCLAFVDALRSEPDQEADRALRDHAIAPALRELIAAGLSDEPGGRPELASLVDVLDGRPVRRPRAWLAGGLAASALAAGAFALTAGRPTASCELAPADGADPVRLFTLRALLAPEPRVPTVSAQAIDLITESSHAIDDAWRASCAATRNGTLTSAQADQRRGCLERRSFELAARIEALVAHPAGDIESILDRVRIADVADCSELTAPRLIGDLDRARSLYRRFAAADGLPFDTARAEAFDVIERDAKAAGDRELAARSTFAAAETRSKLGRVEEADTAIQQSYREAFELHAVDLQALVLLARSSNATRRGDPRAAVALATQALELVDHQPVSPATRAKVHANLSYAAQEHGDYTGSLEHVEAGLAAVAQDKHRLPVVEIALRQVRVNALRRLEGRSEDATAAARDNVEWSRVHLGSRSREYAVTLGTLAFVLLDSGAPGGGVAEGKEALDVMAAIGGEDVDTERLDYATLLESAGRFEEARAALAQVLATADSGRNASLRQQRPLIEFRYGSVLCSLGRCEEGLPHVERAIELGTEQYGAGHGYTQSYRLRLLGLQLELDRLDDAERTYAALERNYKDGKDPNEQRLAFLHGLYGSQLALRRGDTQRAAKLAQDALAVFDSQKGEDQLRAALLTNLGMSLFAQGRVADAGATLQRARDLAKGASAGEDVLAEIDIALARVEMARGHREAARTLATAGREVLVRYPMSRYGRRLADEVLGRRK